MPDPFFGVREAIVAQDRGNLGKRLFHLGNTGHAGELRKLRHHRLIVERIERILKL